MKHIVSLLLCSLLLGSCERLFFGRDLGSREPMDNFEYLWEEVDARYSYFELKGIDWQLVRQQYEPRIRPDMQDDELFDVLAEMLNLLRDDHSNLIAPFNVSVYDVALRHPPQYLARTIQEHYLQNPQYTGAFVHDFLAGGQLAYIRYSSFANATDAFTYRRVLERYRDNTKGLILDLRSNGGGSIDNINTLLSPFLAERVQAGSFITRNGPGHSGFGEPQPFFIRKEDTGSPMYYRQPVLVLIDRGSYSATTMFAVATKALPNIRLMGDTTGGGGGLPNGGQLPNGWTYRISISQLLDLQGRNYAEEGVPPDIRADFDWSDLSKDEILEAAMQELL